MKFLTMRDAQVPALGFGTFQMKGEVCERAVEAALRIGYRHIDTAQIYENEAEVGRVIAASGIARPELFVTTKLWKTNVAPERVIASTEESLRKLGMDYVDLLLIHWPVPAVPLGETLSAMQELLDKGRTKAIGVSNFPAPLMREAVETCKAPIACNQVEYHALKSQRAVLDYAQAHEVMVTAYSPLARGKVVDHPVLMGMGKKYGKTASQVALRWLIGQPGVSAIPKASTEEKARANFNIFDFELNPADHLVIAAIAPSP